MSSPVWRKSSRSGAQEGACIEVARLFAAVGVRDSKDPAGPVLTFSPATWRVFTDRVRTGRHDLA